MKTIKINYTTYVILTSLETERDIMLLVKRPKGKKTYLASLYPNGTSRVVAEMPADTTTENVFVK